MAVHEFWNAQLEMPVNMAMKRPRSRIVRLEPNRDFVVRLVAQIHHIPLRRVHKIIRRIPRAAHNRKRVAMHMDRVRRAGQHLAVRHRRRNGDLDDLVPRDADDCARGKNVLCALGAAQDLQQVGHARRRVRVPVHGEHRARRCVRELDVEVDVLVRAVDAGLAERAVVERLEVRLNERERAGGLGRGRLGRRGADVAQDGRVDAAVERLQRLVEVGLGPHPVVPYLCVCVQHEGVPLAYKRANQIFTDVRDGEHSPAKIWIESTFTGLTLMLSASMTVME